MKEKFLLVSTWFLLPQCHTTKMSPGLVEILRWSRAYSPAGSTSGDEILLISSWVGVEIQPVLAPGPCCG